MEKTQFLLPQKQFKQEYLNELINKKWLTEVEIKTQNEMLADMNDRLERMKSSAEISQKAIEELQKDPSYEARSKRKIEEETLKSWQKKAEEQQKAIDITKIKIEAFENNLIELNVYLKNAENNN